MLLLKYEPIMRRYPDAVRLYLRCSAGFSQFGIALIECILISLGSGGRSLAARYSTLRPNPSTLASPHATILHTPTPRPFCYTYTLHLALQYRKPESLNQTPSAL